MNVFELFGRLTIDGIQTVDAQLRGVEERLASTGKAMTQAGRTMSMYVSAPLTALGVGAFKVAGDFDQSFRAVNVMLKASEEEADRYKARILEISSATGKSAEDVTSAFYQIVSAGYRGADSLDILETAMKGAVGGAADATTTTAALTKAMNMFSLEGLGGATKAMDVFFGIVDAGLLTFEEMASAFPQAATMAAGLGVSIEETGAALATLTKVSGSTQEAATALNATFAQLISPSVAMMDLYKEWGVINGPQAIKKFGGLNGVLLEVQKATGGEVDKLSELFPNIRAIRGVLPLVTTAAEDFAGALDTVADSTGNTGEAFDEMAQGPGFQWQQMVTGLKNSSIVLGDALAETLGPIIQDVTKFVSAAVKAFAGMPEPIQKGIVVVGILVAAIGPLLLTLGLASQGLAAMIGLLKAASIAQIAQRVVMIATTAVMKAVTVAQWLLNAAMTANPIGIVIVAIGALVAVLAVLVLRNDEAKAKLLGAWDAIKGFFSRTWEAITGLFEGNMGKIFDLVMLPVTWPLLIAKNWDAIKDAMLGPITAAHDAIAGLMDRIKGLLSPLTAEQSAGGMIGVGGLGEIRKMQGVEGYATGGTITEPTLLYGLRSQKPYAIAGEAGPESVVPHGQESSMVNHFFQGASITIREEADIAKIEDAVGRALYKHQALRTRYA